MVARVRRGGHRVVAGRPRAERVDHDDAGARHDGRGRARRGSDRPGRRGGPRCVAGGRLGLGVLLYVATRVAMVIMARWGTFRRHALDMYRKQGGLSLGTALLLSIALSVPGEELFWRGSSRASSRRRSRVEPPSRHCSRGSRSCLRTSRARTWRSRPARWSGAVWVALAWWTGGVLASLACHIVWTGMMVAFPVLRAPTETTT